MSIITKRDYEEWRENQEVVYTLVATVNDEVIAKATASDVDSVIAQANKVEMQTEQFLVGEWQDAEIDWDSVADDMAERAGWL